ncbi:MAG: MbnP family protein [Saprospiraceae bacterium]
MKILNNYVICFLLITLMLSCHKDDSNSVGDLNLRFKLVYGDEPMEMFKEYPYPGTGDKFMMTRLSFYISDITVISKDGSFNLKDVDYLNLTAAHTAPVSPNGMEYKLQGILARDFDALSFSIGVNKISNALEPKDFKSGHILSSAAEYWSAWKSYIFFRPEGQITFNTDPNEKQSFALHLGGDEALRSFILSRPIKIIENASTDFDITIDIKKFFSGTNTYDIRSTQQIHSLNQKPLITILADNLATAVK